MPVFRCLFSRTWDGSGFSTAQGDGGSSAHVAPTDFVRLVVSRTPPPRPCAYCFCYRLNVLARSRCSLPSLGGVIVAFALSVSLVNCSTALGLDGLVADRDEDAGTADATDRTDATGVTGADGAGGCASVCGTAGCGVCPNTAPVQVSSVKRVYGIDPYEVTVAEYKAWLDTQPTLAGQPATCLWNDSFEPGVISAAAMAAIQPSGVRADPTCDGWLGKQPAGSGSRTPVACVDWCDAMAYCKWANKHLCGRIGGGSLPFASYADAAESEWYRACSSSGASSFPYGNAYEPARCNDEGHATSDVGSYPRCVGGVAGLFDMSGNVSEWEDACTAFDNPPETQNCLRRGGAFFDGSDHLGCEPYREVLRGLPDRGVGIRCCTGE